MIGSPQLRAKGILRTSASAVSMGIRTSRMPSRWVALTSSAVAPAGTGRGPGEHAALELGRVAVHFLGPLGPPLGPHQGHHLLLSCCGMFDAEMSVAAGISAAGCGRLPRAYSLVGAAPDVPTRLVASSALGLVIGSLSARSWW